MPAGNVLASLSGGGLLLTGDGSANGVLIVPAGVAGAYVVAGFDHGGAPTTINGAAFAVVRGVTDDFDLNMAGGNDALAVIGVSVPDQIKIEAGLGDDFVAVLNSVAGRELDINTDQGSDFIYLDGVSVGSTPFDDSDIDAGRRDDQGNDVVIILNSRFEDNVLVDLDDGDDVLAIGGSTFLGRFDALGDNGFDIFADLSGNTFADGPHLAGFEQTS